jgi:type II secretory pathway predicted ATPase ExeA
MARPDLYYAGDAADLGGVTRLRSMYNRHFGLSGAPFQFTPSPKLLFMSKAHREARAALEWSLEQEPSGFSLLIGETGTGKTTLIISLLAQSRTPLRVAYVSNPKLGLDGLLRDIARQLGVLVYTDRLEQFCAFGRYLDELAPHERAVVIVDEAQALSDEILDDLRLFSNRELHSEGRFHFVFVGQPSLMTRLSAPQLRQVNERIGMRALLKPLEPAEARAYVDYRLAAYGGSAEALFVHGALEQLLAHSSGIPRRINVFCHNALLRAYQAGEFRVSVESARCSVLEVEDLLTGAQRQASMYAVPEFAQRHFRALFSNTHGLAPALMAATLAIAGIGSLYLWNSGTPRGNASVSINAGSTVGDAVIEYPGANDASNVSFSSDRSVARGIGVASAGGDQDRPQPRQLRVRPGDTLLIIARDYLGSDDDVDRLISANPQIGNVNHIYPGEMLNLPASRASRPSVTRETAASEWRRVTPGMSGITYDGE